MINNFDTNLSKMIINSFNELAKKEKIFYNELNDSKVKITGKSNKKIYDMIYKNYSKNITIRKFKFSKLLVAILVSLLMISLVFGASSIKNKIFNAINEWCNEYFVINYVNSSEPSQKKPPQIIEKIYAPTDLPINTKEQIVANNQTGYASIFLFDDGTQINYLQVLLNNNDHKVNSQNVTLTTADINGHTATISISDTNKHIYIIWNNDEYVFIVYGNQPLSSLISFARSIK